MVGSADFARSGADSVIYETKGINNPIKTEHSLRIAHMIHLQILLAFFTNTVGIL